jgi:hypothetical protein
MEKWKMVPTLRLTGCGTPFSHHYAPGLRCGHEDI